MKQLGQDIPVITFDLQLYVIAQTLQFESWDELGHFVIRLGGFHMLEMFWKILGKRYGETGLMDLLTESKVFVPNIAKVIMVGKNHKRCSLAYKLMHEVMSRMQWTFLGMVSFKEVNIPKRGIKTRNVSESSTKRNETPS